MANWPEIRFSETGARTSAPPISWLMGLSLSRPNLLSLAAGFTDNDSLPVRATQRLIDRQLKSIRQGQEALQYGATEGATRLRALTVERVKQLDNLQTDSRVMEADRCLITNGSQQLLHLVTQALCDSGDIVLVEDPTYFVYLGILQSAGVRAKGIRMTHNGMDPDALEACLGRLAEEGQLARVKMVYMVSYFQNPTGRTTDLATKRKVLKIIKKYESQAGHRIFLLEDAAYRELGFDGVTPVSALSLPGARDRVIYAGTYSKPFATGIRAGFGILPKKLYDIVYRLKGNQDFGTAHLIQHILIGALESGIYKDHLLMLQERYQTKAVIMSKAIKRYFPDSMQWAEASGGLYIWAESRRGLMTGAESELFKASLKADVLYVPGSLCYCNDSSRPIPDNGMRLSFGGAKTSAIREGIKRLGRVLHEIL